MKAKARMAKLLLAVAMAAGMVAQAGVELGAGDVSNVVARQRWPWNGLVDITCTVAGIDGTNYGLDFAVAAVMDSGVVHSTTNFWVVQDGKKSASQNVSTNGNYRLVWDAGADLGTGEIHSNVVVRVTAKGHAKVQLWEGGPSWATTNVGAEKPEAYGYYFWWGDTVGYTNTGSGWISVKDGTGIPFTTDTEAGSTFNKDLATLQGEGWITEDGILAPGHDAAHVHWGGGWRMPTKQELDDLISKCDWRETEQNGVNGWTVTGRNAYKTASIFLPCAGSGIGNGLYVDTHGRYWSSVPTSDYSQRAWQLLFPYSYSGSLVDKCSRSFGVPVRPVKGFTE